MSKGKKSWKLLIRVIFFLSVDSFCYYIETEKDLYQVITSDQSGLFDLTNYPTEAPPGGGFNFKPAHYPLSAKPYVPGKFKDEMGGSPIREFVGLRAKVGPRGRRRG